MKALMCHNYYQAPGGEDQVFHDECELLHNRGQEVVRYRVHNDALASMGRWESAKKSVWNAQTYQEVRGLIRKHAPDVVHCANTFPLMSPSVYYAAAAEAVPVVQTLHNFRIFCPAGTLLRNHQPCELCLRKSFAWPAMLHRCYRSSVATTAASSAMHAYHRFRGTWDMVSQYIALTDFSRGKFIAAGLPADKIVVKPNFVQPDPGFRENKEDYVVFVGRLSPEKGIDVLLDAWRSEQRQIPLKIVGDGPLGDMVRAHCRANPMIQWLGAQPFERTLQLIAAARMLVFPSIWYETFGRSMIEAKAAGTPVIASDLGAMAELNTHGENGLLFEAGNAVELRTQVESVWDDDALARRLALGGRAQFESQFTADHNFHRLMEVYLKAGVQGVPQPEVCTL